MLVSIGVGSVLLMAILLAISLGLALIPSRQAPICLAELKDGAQLWERPRLLGPVRRFVVTIEGGVGIIREIEATNPIQVGSEGLICQAPFTSSEWEIRLDECDIPSAVKACYGPLTRIVHDGVKNCLVQLINNVLIAVAILVLILGAKSMNALASHWLF